MSKMKQIYIVIGVVLGLSFLLLTPKTTMAQEGANMYFLHSVPQSGRLNPATNHDFSGYFGGLIVPINGQILPSINFGVNLNSFCYSDLIYKPGGAFGDSLALVFSDSILGRKFVDGLKPINRIDFHTYIDLLHFGFRLNDVFWSFSAVEKIEAGIAFPRDILRLPLYGNANFPDPVIDLSNFGGSVLHYREFGVGANYQYTTELSFGAKAKVLFGMANINMAKTDIQWETDPATSNFQFNADFDINMTQPILDITDLRYDTEGDSLIFENTEKDFDPLSYLMNMKNMGVAFDFGATYSPISDVTVYASITDLGFIRWKDQVTNIKAKGQFDFTGLNLNDLLDDSINMGDAYIDSLFNMLDLKLSHESYKTTVPLNVYLGGTYNLTDVISFGALYHGRRWFDEFQSAFTISANVNRKGFGAVLSYTAMKNNMDNLGFGVAFRVGGWQTFIMTNNLLDAIYPQNARDITLRIGSNWILGRKKTDAALLR
ncbi:MAG: DUF5723 family protein [Salinivirgaceae bacterium]|nr:DUF5723 family protein [Salinivirgaceae bacterium]